MCGQIFKNIENFEKRSDKFIKKCKISENVLTNFSKNRKLQKMYRQIFKN